MGYGTVTTNAQNPYMMQQPVVMQPGMVQPVMMQPGMQQPGMMQPGMMQPGMMQPGMMKPGVQQPAYQQPSTESDDKWALLTKGQEHITNGTATSTSEPTADGGVGSE